MSDQDLWRQRFDGHPALDALDQWRNILSSLEMEDRSSEQLVKVQRLRRVASLTAELLDGADPELVPKAVLDQIHSQLQQLVNQTNQYKQSPNDTHLDQAVNSVDALLNIVRGGVQPSGLTEEITSAREATESWRRSVGQHLRHLESDVTSFRENVQAQEQKLQQIEQQAQQHLEETRNKGDERLNQLQTSIDELRSSLDSQKGRVDTIIEEHQKRFTEAQETRSTKFQGLLDTQEETASTRLDEIEKNATTRMDDLASSAQETIEEILGHKERVEEVTTAVTATALGGHYKEYADDERDEADQWRKWAVWLAGAVGAAGIFAFIWLFVTDAEPSVEVFLGRLALALPLGAVAAYAGREASKHRRNSKQARTVQLDLLALEPYLASLDETAADKIRTVVALRVFGRDPVAHDSKDGDSPTAVDLGQDALESILNEVRPGPVSSGGQE